MYGNSSVPPVLPIPASLQPTRVTTAANISYASSTTVGLVQLAGATSYFGLRFSGERSGWRPTQLCTEQGTEHSQSKL